MKTSLSIHFAAVAPVPVQTGRGGDNYKISVFSIEDGIFVSRIPKGVRIVQTAYALLMFVIFLIPQVSHGREQQALGENRTVRSMLLLDNSVKITKVEKARVYTEKDLAEKEEEAKGLDESELAELSANPPRQTIVYFTFESTTDLQGLMSHSEILKTARVKKVTMKDFCADYWIVPKFPADVLRESDGVSLSWLRDSKVFNLYLVPTRIRIGDRKTYRFYGCVFMHGEASSGINPSIQIDAEGKRTDK